MDIKKLLFKKIFNKISLNNNKKLILIDGISCSGKTQFSNKLKSYLTSKKLKIKIISKDLFLKSRKERIKILKKSKKNVIQNRAHYDLKKFYFLIKNILKSKEQPKNIMFNNLYNRLTGKNDKSIKIRIDKNYIYIFEGIYIHQDLKNTNSTIINILLVNNIFLSLSNKIERIRDNQITVKEVFDEFVNIHLKSFLIYLKKKNNYDLVINIFNKKYSKKNFLLITLCKLENF